MLDDFLHVLISFERTLKEIEWTIIFVVDEVLEVVFDGYSKFIAIIIFPDFKLNIFEFAVKILKCPILFLFPILSTSFIILTNTIDDNRQIFLFILLNELFNC